LGTPLNTIFSSFTEISPGKANSDAAPARREFFKLRSRKLPISGDYSCRLVHTGILEFMSKVFIRHSFYSAFGFSIEFFLRARRSPLGFLD
jgi:hypothetical protein